MAAACEVGIANCYPMVHKLNISLFVLPLSRMKILYITIKTKNRLILLKLYSYNTYSVYLSISFSDCRKVLEVGVVTWSLATAIIPVVAGFMPGLVLSRILVNYLRKVFSGLLVQNLLYLLCLCIHRM